VRVATWIDFWGSKKSKHYYITRNFSWENCVPDAGCQPNIHDDPPAGGKPLWWLDGLDAIPAGAPGNGGDAGVLTSTLDTEEYGHFEGGQPGPRGSNDEGGEGMCYGGEHGLRNYTALGSQDRSGSSGAVAKIFCWSTYHALWLSPFIGFTTNTSKLRV